MLKTCIALSSSVSGSLSSKEKEDKEVIQMREQNNFVLGWMCNSKHIHFQVLFT
jgi:hypothetical protein